MHMYVLAMDGAITAAESGELTFTGFPLRAIAN
jgi:hypothetical protein